MGILAFLMFDPTYWLFIAPAVLLALWAQFRVKSAYAYASQQPARSGLSGAEVAQRILNSHGITDVAIEPVRSFLGDHYDSRHRALRLSPDVYHGRSLAALGIAAHEAGHAIQHAHGYGPLALRSALVPMATLGSNGAVLLIILGFVLGGMRIALGPAVAVLGLVLFGMVVLFQLVNLPVEFNASSRARQILLDNGMVTGLEDPVVGKVLNAAALTYVAATLTALMELLYWASLVLGRRDE